MKSEIVFELDALLADLARDQEPGGAVAVCSEGELVYERAFGCANLEYRVPITARSVFHVASLSKQFTALAIALLAREGRLALDADVRDYVPELHAEERITLRHLIHHTSGLRDQWDLLSLAGWGPADLKTSAQILHLTFRQRRANFSPGARYQYINTGYTLLATIAERVSGQSLQGFCAARIFEPLGMVRTCFQDDHRRVIADRAYAYFRDSSGEYRLDMPAYETVGPTGLLSTVEDFARWERNFLKPQVGDSALTAERLAPGRLADGSAVNYGFGLVLGEYRGARIIEHSGGDGAFRAHYMRVPDAAFAVAIFCNTTACHPRELARRITDLALTGALPDAPTAHTNASPRSGPGDTSWAGRAAGAGRVAPDVVQSRVGSYRELVSGQTGRIELREARPFLVSGDGGEYELVPVTPDRFVFASLPAECRFRERAGEPLEMCVYYEGQLTGQCERTASNPREPAAPEEFRGRYFSAELEIGYRIECDAGALKLQNSKLLEGTLEGLGGDEFYVRACGWQLRFTRDVTGKVTGLTLSAERAWNVRFTRETMDVGRGVSSSRSAESG